MELRNRIMQKKFSQEEAFRVLVIEDDPDHAELIRRSLSEHPTAHEIINLEDGEVAMNFLAAISLEGTDSTAQRPHIILLDLRLPKISGHTILKKIKSTPKLQSIPVIILTTSNAPQDVTEAYLNHANSYLIKPQDFQDFVGLVEVIGTFWLDWNTKEVQPTP